MSNLKQLAIQLKHLDDKIISCMKCGLCQAVCPVFSVSMMEADVARGKLALVDNLSQNIIEDPIAVADKLGRCLLCGSCQANCPSGVSIMDIFIEARQVITAYNGLHPLKKLIFRQVLARPKLFSSFVDMAIPFQFLVMRKNNNIQETSKAPLLQKMIGSRHFRRLPQQTLQSKYVKIDTTSSEKSYNIAFFPGCLGDKLYTHISEACLKVFKYHNIGVFMPHGLACCGIPAIASGDIEGMVAQTRVNLNVLKEKDFDYIITACSSCTSTIKEHWPSFTDSFNPEEKRLAQLYSEKAIDVNAFLIDVLKVDPLQMQNNKAQKTKVTFHDSCHLKKSLNVSSQPRKLIENNPNYEIIEMKDADKCCGCGGSFTLFHYDLSLAIGEKKRQSIIDTNAGIVASGCPACIMQMEDVLSQNNDNVKVKHAIELYAEALPQ